MPEQKYRVSRHVVVLEGEPEIFSRLPRAEFTLDTLLLVLRGPSKTLSKFPFYDKEIYAFFASENLLLEFSERTIPALSQPMDLCPLPTREESRQLLSKQSSLG